MAVTAKQISTDKRRVEFQYDPEADRLAGEAFEALFEAQLRLAKRLVRVWDTALFVRQGCSSIRAYGRNAPACGAGHRRSAFETQRLTRVCPEHWAWPFAPTPSTSNSSATGR